MRDTIIFIAYIVLALAAMVGSWRFRQLPTNLRYLVGLVWLEAATEVISTTLHFYHTPNLFINHIFAAGEFWLLALVYDKTLHAPAFSRVRPWLVGIFVGYCILDSILAPEVARFKPTLQLIESALLLGIVGLYFRKLLHELRIARLERDPMFWVSVGLVVNHLGKSQIYLFSNYLLAHYSNQLNLNIWAIHALLLVVLYGCYLVALWIRPQN